MKKNLAKLSILFLLIILLTGGFRCKVVSQKVRERMKPARLTYWRVWDNPDTMAGIINDYRRAHSYVTISYRKLRYEEYEQALLEAWAEDRGPDIFSIPVTWLEKYKKYILPLPEKITMPYEMMTGPSCKREKTVVLKTKKSLTIGDLRNNFVDTVYNNIREGNQIYGLPLSVDTLVLYYNRDLLDNAQIPQPPRDWTEFKEDVQKLTFQDKEGNIVQAGAALGTANNIERSMDILSLLMMQNGTKMSKGRQAVFDRPLESNPNYFPGEEALKFYTDFANPAKEVYSWNSRMPNSLDAFVEGKLAFFFGYSYHLPIIPAPKVFFALPTLSSSPPAVIHMKPPIRITITAINPKKPKTVLRMV